jgi:zinc-ribbon domain
MHCPECGTNLDEGATTCPRCGFSFRLRAFVRTAVLALASGMWLRIAMTDLRHPASTFEACGLVLLLLAVLANVVLIVRGRKAGAALTGLVGCLNLICIVGVVFVVYAISAFLKTFH